MGSLEGRVALVTGASRGIGRAIALELARAGARVALNYRSGEAQAATLASEIAALRASSASTFSSSENEAKRLVDELAARVGVVAVENSPDKSFLGASLGEMVSLFQADVSNSGEARSLVAKVIDKWGRLDILVNNAGITRDRTLRKLGDEDWHAVIAAILDAAFYTVSAALPTMIEQKFGRIVNVGSMVAQAGNIGQANYAAAKGGVIAFTRCIALEMARYNITANVVNPGFSATDMLANVPENIQDQVRSKIPLGRFAKPEEIAQAVLFLVTNGDYITGQQLNVNGGIYFS